MIRPALVLALFGAPTMAATLDMPAGATRATERIDPLGSYAVPVDPWADGALPVTEAEGQITRQAWHVPSTATTLQLLAPLREQLSQQGFEVLLQCETEGCGGFDFRFETDVLPEPEMHVDLGDFRFLSLRRTGEETPEFMTLLISRTSNTGYIQVVSVGPASAEPLTTENLATKTPETTPLAPLAFADQLETKGRAVLGDLSFDTGSAQLSEGPFPSLGALADYLLANPDRQVTLVGHTDAEGGLDANIVLSRARARSVRQRLTEAYGIPPAQLEADGVGYLMPLSSNLTEDGRLANRRVEVVLISTE